MKVSGWRGVGGWDTGELWRRGVVSGDIGSDTVSSSPQFSPNRGYWSLALFFLVFSSSPSLFLAIDLDIPLSTLKLRATSWILLSFALLSSHSVALLPSSCSVSLIGSILSSFFGSSPILLSSPPLPRRKDTQTCRGLLCLISCARIYKS